MCLDVVVLGGRFPRVTLSTALEWTIVPEMFVLRRDVVVQRGLRPEILVTPIALEWPLSGMDTHVLLKINLLSALFWAVGPLALEEHLRLTVRE